MHPSASPFLSLAFDELPGSHQITHVCEVDDPINPIDLTNKDRPTPRSRQPPIFLSNSYHRFLPDWQNGWKKDCLSKCLNFCQIVWALQSWIVKTSPLVPSITPEVSNIIDWVQCFGIYITIISCTAPNRIADLIGYQSLTIQASQDYQKGCWVVYDQRFRLKASASKLKEWSIIDVTIWNFTFSVRAMNNRQRGGLLHSNLSPPNYRTPLQSQAAPKKKSICLD